MKRSSTVTFLLAAALLAFTVTSTGCLSTPDTRVAQLNTAVDFYLAQSVEAEADLVSLRSTLGDLTGVRDQAEASGDSDTITRTLTAIVSIQDKIDHAQEVKTKAEGVVASLNDRITSILADGSVDVSEELELYAGGVKGTSALLPPPLNYVGYGLSALLTGVAGVYRRREKRATAVTEQVVDGVGELLKVLDGGDVSSESATKILKDKQTPHARNVVDTIRKG